ncbi:MAG TPA: hypothetical protein VFV69_14335 [Steroidobacteraceae bacterium]|jgi:hypothetical protein|nr:hypothetical protein [Steroidobacteraceae bacterium]
MGTKDSSWATAGFGESAYAALARGMPASEVWSLLLSAMRERAEHRTPGALAQQWASDRFVQLSYIDQRTLLDLDSQLLAAAPEFEAVELSPLAPLGTCSSIALTTQNRVVSTARGTEVVSDPTNVLALESARRLREDQTQIVRLCTSHRCVRAQEVPKVPGFAAHFRMFCMTTAGHERTDQEFVTDALTQHIRAHLRGLDRLEQHGYRFPNRRVRLLSTEEREPLAKRIESALEGVPVTMEGLEKRYYDGLRFMISAHTAAGDDIPLIDGGAFDWLHKLASNRKLVFVASAIGSQLAAYLYRLPTKAEPAE